MLKLRGLLREHAPRSLTLAEVKASPLTKKSLVTFFGGEHPARYEGVSLEELWRLWAAPGATKIRIVATNRYEQTLPLQGWKGPERILAYERDGKPMPTSERGTFRIVMDLAKMTNTEKEALYPVWVWSVESLEFLP